MKAPFLCKFIALEATRSDGSMNMCKHMEFLAPKTLVGGAQWKQAWVMQIKVMGDKDQASSFLLGLLFRDRRRGQILSSY